MHSRTIQLYDDRPHVTLTTYVLDQSKEMMAGIPRPAVLVCPGGAYLGCSDREAEPVALRFAAMGYHAFVLRYSTYGEGKPVEVPDNAMLPVNPRSVHPAPVRDIATALVTIRSNADEWSVDTNRVAICGFSAGAHNCAMYSVLWNQPIITEFTGVEPDQLRPAAAIFGYGVFDFRLMRDFKRDDEAKRLSSAANVALFGTASPDRAQLEELSPILHVSDKTPPAFLWGTAEDALVPIENTTQMAAAFARANVPFEVHIFESGAHGLSLADQSSAHSSINIDRDAARWADLVQRWLHKRFELPLSE